jgi:hypothetical protein
MNGVQRAVEAAGENGVTRIAEQIATTTQFVSMSKRRGWLPLEKARIVSELYGIPLADLVRADIASALRAQA